MGKLRSKGSRSTKKAKRIMKPICVPCQRFYRPEKNGFRFVEGMPINNFAPPGTARPDLWKPWKLWIGDKWKCQGCGHELVVGVGGQVSEHYMPDFEKKRALGFDYQVNDC